MKFSTTIIRDHEKLVGMQVWENPIGAFNPIEGVILHTYTTCCIIELIKSKQKVKCDWNRINFKKDNGKKEKRRIAN